MLGMSLNIPTIAARARGTSPLFDPRSVNPVAFFDSAQITSLFQGADQTLPVTAAGDPVGYLGDLGSQGHSVTQSDNIRRPSYLTDGTLHWVAGDGVDDLLVHQAIIVSPMLSICLAAEVTSISSTTDALFSLDAASGDFQFDAGSASGFEARFNSSGLGLNSIKSASAHSGAKVFTLTLDPGSGNVTLRVNGAVDWQIGGYNGALSGTQVLNILSNRSAGSRIGAKLFAMAIWNDVNPMRIQNMEGWMAARAGIVT